MSLRRGRDRLMLDRGWVVLLTVLKTLRGPMGYMAF